MNLSDVTGLSDIAHSRSNASGNSPLLYGLKLPVSSAFPAASGGQEGGCSSGSVFPSFE